MKPIRIGDSTSTGILLPSSVTHTVIFSPPLKMVPEINVGELDAVKTSTALDLHGFFSPVADIHVIYRIVEK
jgi:hypothetical protein